MDNINTANVTSNTTLGNLFRECGAGGDATIPGATFMNGVMVEILTAIRNSCQTPIAFDANDPDSYSQLWTAITTWGGTDGVEEWTSGTASSVVKYGDCASTCVLYVMNPDGDSANVAPSSTSDDDWFGPFCSVAEMLANLASRSLSERPELIVYQDAINGTTLGALLDD